MPKYIRTKDGVYELVIKDLKGNFDENEKCILIKAKHNYYFLKKDILKQADTIEELCDEFVYGIDKYNKKPMVAPQNFFETKIKIAKTMKCDLYGAIWCEWGLKYIAKMNDKGELELL